MAYGKIFESMFSGSMVGSGSTVFAVWAYVIANAKPPGFVELNPKLLAAIIGCTVDEILAAMKVLESPDPESRCKDHDGRRLLSEGAFLYHVPSWHRYHDLRNEIERRHQNREAQRRHRQKSSASVSNGQHASAKSAHADADTEAESNHPPTHPSTSTSVPVPSAVPGGWVGGEPPVAMTQTKPQAPTPPVPDRASVPDRAASVPGTVLTIDERLAAAKMGSIEEAEAIADYLGWGLRASGRREMLQGLIAQGMGVHHMVELDRLAKKQGRAPAALAWSWLQSGAWVGIVTETGFPVVPQHLQERFDDDEESPPPPRALRALPPAVGAIYGENQKAPR